MHPPEHVLPPEIKRALQLNLPLVALESAVITHGLPHPQNVTLARDMEAVVREGGAVPATIAVLKGAIRIGLSPTELDELAAVEKPLKISRRDFAPAMMRSASGGTTVAGTMFAASTAGIQVFATGGIGGVHRGVETRARVASRRTSGRVDRPPMHGAVGVLGHARRVPLVTEEVCDQHGGYLSMAQIHAALTHYYETEDIENRVEFLPL